jgi:heat shock protein HtpX
VVAVTEGIVQLLSERELRGVLAHEIAHIKNRDILVASIAAAMTSMLTWAAHAFSRRAGAPAARPGLDFPAPR